MGAIAIGRERKKEARQPENFRGLWYTGKVCGRYLTPTLIECDLRAYVVGIRIRRQPTVRRDLFQSARTS